MDVGGNLGGYGSGRGFLYSKKTTVEDCRSLTIKDLVREKVLMPEVWHKGGWVWRNGHTNEVTSSINYEINTHNLSDAWMRLTYQFTRTKQNFNYPIKLVATEPHYGGCRWWFICPLICRGRPCNRRVSKLFLPPSAVYYGCRHCHDLTYTSSQESHKGDAIFRSLSAVSEITREEFEMLFQKKLRR